MAEFTTSVKEASNRHLRFKLQSLGRRLDELEEATKNLQKAEDEVLDLQDKIIQAEGSNSSMLADVELLRKRVLKIEGKDEEVKKAEDMCRLMKEKLEEEEHGTTLLKSQIEHLQKRIIALERLEEAFGKSKNECIQLGFSLNEEKNVSKKLFTDLEILRLKIKEMEASEDKFEKTEQHFVAELEKIKSFTLIFVNERKQLLEKERQNEKLIQELMQKLEQKDQINSAIHTRNTSDFKEKSKSNLERGDIRIEDDLSSKLSTKESRRKDNLDYLKMSENETISMSENLKNKNQQDNKVKDLNQEIEKLRIQLNHLKSVAEELKQMNAKHIVLHDNYLSEQTKNKVLNEQLEKLKIEIQKLKDLENGDAESEEIGGRFRNDKNKSKTEPSIAKHKSREHSPLSRRERIRSRDNPLNDDRVPQSNRQTPNTSVAGKRTSALYSSRSIDAVMDDPKVAETKIAVASYVSATKDVGSMQNEVKKSREQPSVLSRYPPAAQELNATKSWKVSSKVTNESGPKNRTQKTTSTFGDVYSVNTSSTAEMPIKTETLSVEKAVLKSHDNADVSSGILANHSNSVLANGTVSSFTTCRASPILVTACSNAVSAVLPAPTSSSVDLLEDKPCKTVMNSEAAESIDTTAQNTKSPSASRYPRHSRHQGNILSDPGHEGDTRSTRSEPETRKLLNNRPSKACTLTTNAFTSERFNLEDEVENMSDVAPEKHTVTQPELERKRQCSPREISKSRMTVRTSYFENDKKEHDVEAESNNSSAYSNSVNVSGDNHVGVQVKRPFSPREALRSKAIIKPAIIEKDLKEVMGGIGLEANSERLKSTKTVPGKMTSSITIYPTEPISPRTSMGVTKERHTSTSNIVITPTDLPSVPNNIGSSFEISISKSDMSLTLPPETVKPENVGFQTEPDYLTARSRTAKSSVDETESNEASSETISWKSHSALEVDPALEAKTIETVKGLARLRRGLSPLEELDTKLGITKYCPELPPKPEALADAKAPRISSFEQYSRRTSSVLNSVNTPPELVSRRSKSSLSASELVTRRSVGSDSLLSSGFAPWSRIPLQEDITEVTSRSRRKQFGSSDRLSRIEASVRRQSAKFDRQQDLQQLGSKVEERIRHRKYLSEEK